MWINTWASRPLYVYRFSSFATPLHRKNEETNLSHRCKPRIVVDGKEVRTLRPLLKCPSLRIEPVIEYCLAAGEFDLFVKAAQRKNDVDDTKWFLVICNRL